MREGAPTLDFVFHRRTAAWIVPAKNIGATTVVPPVVCFFRSAMPQQAQLHFTGPLLPIGIEHLYVTVRHMVIKGI